MTIPEAWDPRSAVAHCDIVELKQAVWRGHRRRYAPLDHGGSLKRSARFHRAPGEFLPPALYTALDMGVALGELQRNIRPDDFGDYHLTEIWVQLEAILDCRDMDLLGLSLDQLLDNRDYSLGQGLAGAAVELGAEGILVPSATRFGDNLIVFPHLVRSGSALVTARSLDQRLIKSTGC